MHECIAPLRVEHVEPLVEKYVNRLPPGTFDHEFGASLSENRSRFVNELAGTRIYAQIDAVLRFGRERPLRNRSGSGYQAFGRRTTLSHT